MTDEKKQLTEKDFPEKTLGRCFPNFEKFYNELKKNLGFVVLKIITKVEEEDGKKVNKTDWTETYKKGLDYHTKDFGLGILTRFIANAFYLKYRNRKYLGEQRDFIDEFIAELSFVIAEIRRKEHVWSQICLDLSKWTKLDTNINQKTTSSDKSGKKTHGDNSKYQVMSNELTEKTNQYGNVSAFDQKGGNVIINHKGSNFAPLGKILSSTNSLFQLNFSNFYSRFEDLFETYCSPPGLRYIIDKITGEKRYYTQEEYEIIIEPEPEKRIKKRIKTDPYELLAEYERTKDWNKYLEALRTYHDQNKKEWLALPDSSNRKNRIERRVKIAAGCLKAYEWEVSLPSSQEFSDRIAGKVEGFSKVVGCEKVIDIVVKYLKNWEYSKRYNGSKPQQLMIGLLGDPGLGKTYIAEAIGNALGDGKRLSYHRISMTGKKDAAVIQGSSMENPGGDPGEIVKGVSRCQNQSMVFFFDEIEKAERAAKLAIGEPTDRTANKNFKDDYFDFPTPLNNCIFICALNYVEELDPFLRDRFKMITADPPTYRQRIEILSILLQAGIKKEDEALRFIYNKTWQEVYNLINQENLLKKTLTKSISIRKAKDNVFILIQTVVNDFFMEQKPLLDANEWINYGWKFDYEEDLDLGNRARNIPPCPYALEKLRTKSSNKKHREGCDCFLNNLNRVPGWVENMGND